MPYKEIGELYLEEDLSTGIIKNRNESLAKKTLLYPDSERLLYNYTKDPHVRDMVYYRDEKNERMLFIGRNVFIDYNAETGNFYCENPRHVLKPLCNPIIEGGLALKENDLAAVSENLQYALLVDEWVYIVSKKVNGNVLFRYNIVTREISNIAYEDFTNNIGDAVVLCKMIEYAREIYFFIYKENEIKVYAYNLISNIFTLHETLSSLANTNSPNNMTANMLTALVDKTLKRVYIITTSTNSGNYMIYNFETGEAKIANTSLDLLWENIICSGINTDTQIQNEGLFIATGSNTVYFLSKNDTVFITTKVILRGIWGINNVVRYKNSSGTIQYLIFYTRLDGEPSFVTVNALDLHGTDIIIDIFAIMKAEPLFNVFSNNLNIAGFFFNNENNFNIIYGSYEESGIGRILIKQLSHAIFSGTEHPFIMRGNLEASSSIISVEGSAYGAMQLSRLHLRAENIETTSIADETDIFVRENQGDSTRYTTGSYLWKQLYKIGLPFNKHIETSGRIIIDGYDIPISKTYITQANKNNEYGDVLLTFDKYFNASTIKGALHENITQYPGTLFFKNKGFLADAVISNSYEMEGSLTYNDEANGDLFNVGIHAITACKMLDDGTLLVAGNYGCLASININTKGYTNIKGVSVGDNPPPYYIPIPTVANNQEPDNIKAIIPWKNKIFILTNKGTLLRTYLNTNYWQEINNPDAALVSNLVHYLNNRNNKAYAIKDNLLLISWPFGSLSSFDLDSEVYTPITHGNTFPTTMTENNKVISGNTVTGDSLVIGNRIYFVGGVGKDTGNTLCWFDIASKSFGFAKGTCDLIGQRTKDKVDLTTDGKDIYLLLTKNDISTLIKYDIALDTFTTLENTLFKHSRCGIYYYNNCIYALFGIDGNNDKYIQVYYFATRSWMAFKVSNTNLPTIYEAKGFLQQGVDNGLAFTKINLFWGISNDNNIGVVDFSNIIEVELQNVINPQDSVSIGVDLDIEFKTLRYIGYSLEYDSVRNEVYIANGLISGTNEISKRVHRINFNTKEIILSYDNEKPSGVFYNVSALINHYLYSIGGYSNSSLETIEDISIFSIREGNWHTLKSLAYNAGTALMNNRIPVITSMKIIYPGNMLVISYMDGGIGSLDLRTGEMILPTDTSQLSLNSIHALPGEYSDRGAYTIYEDDEDVNFVCVDHEFKFAKHIGVFFKKQPSDSTSLTITTGSMRPYPLTGSSQVAIGKYIVFLNGYDHKEANWQETLHKNIVVLDTSTGEYATLGVDVLTKHRYNAYSHYYNGYIYTFGGIQRYIKYESGATEYERRAIIERYDLVTGQAIVLHTTYGLELNQSANGMVDGAYVTASNNSSIGRNQIIQLTPFSCFGEREDNTILASIILANDNVANNHLIRRMFLFDLISETEYSNVTLPELTFGNNNAVILCERKATKELYAFLFHTELEPPLVNRNEYCELSVLKYSLHAGVSLEETILYRIPIKSPLKYQNYISGLCEIIYNEEEDVFIIPSLAKNLPSIADKRYLATTIGYEYNPVLNTINEIARDGSNLVKLMENENSLPLNNKTLANQIQYNSSSLLRVHSINNKYTLVNPTAEVITQYTKEELFRNKTPINNMVYDEWSDEDKALYTLFTYREDLFEIAANVKPGMDNFIHQYKETVLRPVIITHDSPLLSSLDHIPLIGIPEDNQSLFLIIGFDLDTKKFSIVHSEIIQDLSLHSYSVASGLVNGILWSFINYIDTDSLPYISIISYDIDTKTAGHHNSVRVSSDSYDISSQYDLPRCIVNQENNLVYIILVNRRQLSHTFTGAIYTFFGLNYASHITNVDVSKITTIFNTLLPEESDYYNNLSINCNGYILRNNLFIDIFNGKNGEISYTVKAPISSQRFINQDEIKVKYFNQYYRSIPLQDTNYITSFKDGIIQDIYGYKISYEGDKAIINPIIVLDSFDVIKDSSYEKTRSYILFDRLNAEVPKATFSFVLNDNNAHIVLKDNDGLSYLTKESNGIVELIKVKEIKEDKYINIKKTGRLPLPKDIGSGEITTTKSAKLDANSLFSLFITSGDNKTFPYKFDTTKRMYSFINALRYATENYIDGILFIIDNSLYCIGRDIRNNNYITLHEFDVSTGILLDVRTLINTEIEDIKGIYNTRDRTIYLFGGTVLSITNLINITVYTYNIDTKVSNPYLSASALDEKVVDAYYYEDLNKTFIQLKTSSASSGNLLIFNHDTITITKCMNQNNPIITERMIKTKGGALAYINKDFGISGGAHHVFDPVTFNYIDIASNNILGQNIANEVPSEIIPLEDKNIALGLKLVNNPGLYWGVGPLFFSNATYSPIDFSTKRLFTFDGEVYLYGKENQHEIYKYSKENKAFELYDNIAPPAINDNNYFTSKVYLDGNVRLCFINLSPNQNEVDLSIVLYNIIAKKLFSVATIPITVNPMVSSVYSNLDLSIKPLWVSHYLLFILHSPNHAENFVIKVNLLTNIATSHPCGTNINAKSALEWFYDRIISLGGHLPGNSDINYDLISFRIDNNNIQPSIKKFTLPVTHNADKKSIFISAKSAKKISTIYLTKNKNKEASVHYDDTNIDIIMANLTSTGGNGVVNGSSYTPYITPQYLPNDLVNELQIAAFEDEEYLTDLKITPYHISYKENNVLIGVYDKLINPTHNSQLINYNYATKLRMAHLEPDLIAVCSSFDYLIHFYSGITQDTITTFNRYTKEKVSSVSFERDYGNVITGVEALDDDKFIIIYDNNPAIGTVIIHSDGNITIKRYDGTIFGRPIDPGSSNHTLQEVDLTFLFDSESSEYDIRGESI